MGAGEGSWGRNGSFGELAQLDKLLPGDLVIFWGEGERLVRTLFLCREGVMGRTYEWRWLFLDDGTLLEISPDGYYRYRRHLLVKQGTPLYEELVAQDGALVRFEERVRAGVSGRRPVHVTVEDETYRIASTGTVTVERFGAEPDLACWRAFAPDPSENVYFGMVSVADEERVALGLWTTHVCLSFGRPLRAADVDRVYQR
ncbi:MAG TPA: hypothetical protein VIN09_01675 [Chloroflexota bacterium]